MMMQLKEGERKVDAKECWKGSREELKERERS